MAVTPLLTTLVSPRGSRHLPGAAAIPSAPAGPKFAWFGGCRSHGQEEHGACAKLKQGRVLGLYRNSKPPVFAMGGGVVPRPFYLPAAF